MNINLTKAGATYSEKRAVYYEWTGPQLDCLFHDIEAGKFGETAKTSTFYLRRKTVKDKYPKA